MKGNNIMSSAKIKPLTIFVLRIILGIIFVVAAYNKLLHMDVLTATVINYNILPVTLAKYFAYAFPWIEIIAGVMLITGLGTRGASLAIVGLLVSFIIAIAINMYRGVSIDCGCFGGLFGMHENIGAGILIRDSIFLVVAVFLTFTKEFMFSADSYLGKK